MLAAPAAFTLARMRARASPTCSPAAQARFDGHGRAAVVVDRCLVKVRWEGSPLQVHVGPELLAVGVPQVLHRIRLQLVAEGTVFLLRGALEIGGCQQVIQRGDEQGVVVDIQGGVAVFVEHHAPFMFRLHIAPVGGGAPRADRSPARSASCGGSPRRATSVPSPTARSRLPKAGSYRRSGAHSGRRRGTAKLLITVSTVFLWPR